MNAMNTFSMLQRCSTLCLFDLAQTHANWIFDASRSTKDYSNQYISSLIASFLPYGKIHQICIWLLYLASFPKGCHLDMETKSLLLLKDPWCVVLELLALFFGLKNNKYYVQL